jgi:very-short-patch-repair endonuclease
VVRRDIDSKIFDLARCQASTFSREQAYSIGATAPWVARRVRAGYVEPLGCDVFALAGSAASHDRRRWTGLLAAGPGARLTHEAAADLYRIEGLRRGLVVVTVAHPRHLVIPGVTLHQLDDLAVDHTATVAGWPTTTPARAIVDLASVVSWVRLATALESVVVERLATFGDVGRVLSDVRRRGKPGVRKLLSVLLARSGEPPPASVLERELHKAAALAGVPIVRQFPLPWKREPEVGVVDAAVPGSRLILEADGRKWHARMEAMAKDRRRDRAAVRAGWQPLRWMYEDFNNPAAVAAELHAIHTSRVSEQRNTRA